MENTKNLYKRPKNKMEKVGPGMWLSLEGLAEEYFRHPKKYTRAVTAIFRKIPCPRCAHDALNYLEKNPIKNPIVWICEFHNHVNRKTGKVCQKCKDFPTHTPSGQIIFKNGQV